MDNWPFENKLTSCPRCKRKLLQNYEESYCLSCGTMAGDNFNFADSVLQSSMNKLVPGRQLHSYSKYARHDSRS